jgi:hypothetical protein
MRPINELSLDLTAQELLDLPDFNGFIEIEDINLGVFEQWVAPAPSTAPVALANDSEEIELTSEEIDALLEGR